MKQITLTFTVPVLDWDRLSLLVRAELVPKGIIPTDQDVVEYIANTAQATLNDLCARAEQIAERDRLIASGEIEIGRPAGHLRLVP